MTPGHDAAPGRGTEGVSVAVGTVSTLPSLPAQRDSTTNPTAAHYTLNATTGEPVALDGSPAPVLTTDAEQAFLHAQQSGPVPIYGSPEYAALAPSDPRKTAAVFRAAECWRDQGRPERIAQRLQDDETEFRARVRSASHDVSAAAHWTALANTPPHAELMRRRAEPVVPSLPRQRWDR